jgi:integrase
VVEFLEGHLPHCNCATNARHPACVRAALAHLLVVLRDADAIAPKPQDETPVGQELRRYDQYMTQVRGLAPKTREGALRLVEALLRKHFGDDDIQFEIITAEHVRRFFAAQAKNYKAPSSLGAVVSALRGYFRWRATLGDRTHALVGALAYPANWQLASLPKSLEPAEVEQLEAALGQSGPSMLRADAMVRCALDLGLRSGEVARLSLDDIDWDAGTITLRRTKGRREDVMPLPEATGQAIAAVPARRAAQDPAPDGLRPAHDAAGATRSARTSCARPSARPMRAPGLPHTRSHLLRHTMASRLLAGGSSLKEVADVLRHRSLNTTLIYAKLDSGRLVEVALPWPGNLRRCRDQEGVMTIGLTALVERYLTERRTLGFQLRSPAYSLRSLAEYVRRTRHRGPLTLEVMAEWARLDSHASVDPRTWARRLKHLRSFARWMQQFEPATEVPDDTIFGRLPERQAPHIYSQEEVRQLLAAARELGPSPGLRGLVYETLFGLIASCGLRLSEALSLNLGDVDLRRGLLTIRRTKFAKSRQVPLHPSTAKALGQYRWMRDVAGASRDDDAPFFIGTRGRLFGKPMSGHQVERVFATLRSELGWVNRGTHHATRIHDLRHTFVVRRILLWQQQGIDVDEAMLSLSTYVGHAMVTNTYWYLQAVPELMAVAAQRFESCMPELSHV